MLYDIRMTYQEYLAVFLTGMKRGDEGLVHKRVMSYIEKNIYSSVGICILF